MVDYDELYDEFWSECEAISEECVAEGYPARGSNYDLRVENLMHDPRFEVLFAVED